MARDEGERTMTDDERDDLTCENCGDVDENGLNECDECDARLCNNCMEQHATYHEQWEPRFSPNANKE
jgi:methionyl-tRNA synthetase